MNFRKLRYDLKRRYITQLQASYSCSLALVYVLENVLRVWPGEHNRLLKLATVLSSNDLVTMHMQICEVIKPDYLRKISLKMLSIETKTQHTPPINSSMPNTTIPNQNPTDQVGNQGQSLAIPMVNPFPARQQLLPQNLQNNTSTAVQSSANLPSALSSIAGLGQSNISSVGQTSNLQNMPGISQNSVSNSVGQGAAPDIYANVQRQMQGRQYQQHVTSEQQQQSQNQLIYQHQLQQQLLKQKLQHCSLLQPHMQQQQQEQSLLRPTQLQSSQQSLIQMPSGLQSGQSTIQQTQPTTMQSAVQPVFQQIQLNSIQQSVPSLLQQHPQSVARQQQQQEAQPSIHQQTPSLQRQPTPVPQQSNLPLQQQIVGQQADISNTQQAQLLGQQSSVQDMQRPWQQRRPVQQNSLLGMQQPQQMLNQQSIYLHQEQQLGPQISLLGLQQQQLQQQQLLGFLANVSNVQPHQHSVHILQQSKMVTQQQQQTQQTPLALLQPQGQESQHQSSPQQLISQIQSEPVQLQQQLAMQQQPNSLQQGLQTPSALLRSQNAIEQQKHFIQAQRVLRDVSSNTSVDSIAQTGDAGVADLQEEIYQKIKSWREMYFTDLNEFYQKVALKLQQHDALIPPAKPSEQFEKMKTFKTMLERTLVILQISKNNIQPGLKEKLPLYERQIHNVLASTKKKGIPSQSQGQQQFQHPGGLAHSMPQQQPSQVSQLQQHDKLTITQTRCNK
uniref:Mediator of RNA polymerase II transcription subunit 15a-like n=1 Tax=Elaeis guineensis var. tenera TaxID=51953 RepID=A0A6J0PPR2_ELAGV|nr:mediator of RNA polymerase II transcription subunit 15a-like [Elaeis guineensis]